MSAFQQEQQSAPNRFVQCVVTGLCVWVYLNTAPAMIEGEIVWIPMLALCLAAILGISLFTHGLMMLAYFFSWLSIHQDTGLEGTARWGEFKDIKPELSPKQSGPFWGMLLGKKRRPLFIDYASNSMTVAPSGSGKGIYTVVVMGLSIRFGKVFSDFKGELVCILKAALEKRGEIVRTLNPSGLWADIIGESDSYNPIDIIVDDLYRRDGLRDVADDLREYSAQISPEPAEQDSDDSYWREGGRRIISDVTLLEAMIEGYDASLASVALLIEDRKALEHNLRWVVGVDLKGQPLKDGAMPIEQAGWAQYHSEQDMAEFAAHVRARAGNLLALMCAPDSKTFDSFIGTAQQALAPYAFGRLAPAMRRSTFRMDDLKDPKQITNLFIVADSSRMETFKKYIGLIQWCAMTAMKRHDNKKQPVYFINDECTQYKVFGLEDLLTWGRSYSLRIHLIFQSLSAFEKTYGKSALQTLYSETEVKQFLPGQRSPKTLELICQLLGKESLMNASMSMDKLEDGTNAQMNEKGRPLLTPDEIRRMWCGILIVRQSAPLLIEPVSYGAVKPWRKQVGINPMHGKPFLQKVKLKLKNK